MNKSRGDLDGVGNNIRRVIIDDSQSSSSNDSESSQGSIVDSTISEESVVEEQEVREQIVKESVRSPTRMKLDKFPVQMLIVGPTEAGKTNLVKNIIFQIRDKFQYILVFCETAKLNRDYDFLPSKYILDWNEELLESVIELQNRYKEEGKEYHCLLVFDDIVGRIKTHNSDIFDRLASSSRHSNISIIYITQQATKISTTIRTNAGVVFATQINKSESDILFERSKCFKSKAEMWEIVNREVNKQEYKFLLLQKGLYQIISPAKCKKFTFKYEY